MFFARYAKQQHAERNSSNAVAEEQSHNALAQLSREFAINSSAPLRTFWRRFCWGSAQRNCFTRAYTLCRGCRGSVYSSRRAHVSINYYKSVVGWVGRCLPTFKGRAGGSDTFLAEA